MKEFIVLTHEGSTYDDEGWEVENDQVLDYIDAENIQEARKIVSENFKNNVYGFYMDYEIVEKAELEAKQCYVVIKAPAELDCCTAIIDDVSIEIFDNKIDALCDAISKVDEEILLAEVADEGFEGEVAPKHSSVFIQTLGKDYTEEIDELDEQKLSILWRELKSAQHECLTDYHVKIKDHQSSSWL